MASQDERRVVSPDMKSFPRRSPLRDGLMALAVLCLVALATPARAGAWLQVPGEAYVKASWLHLRAEERWTRDGGREAAEAFGGTYREHQAFVYAEVGVHPRATAVLSMAAKDARIVDARVPDYGTRSTGDLRVGARWGILTGPLPVSLETLVGLPTYPETDPRAPIGAREQFLPAGTGHVEVETRLQAGFSLFPLPLYANVDLGHRARGGAFGDQWLIALEVGASGERLFVKSDLRGIVARGGVGGSASAGAVSLNERVWSWAPEVAFRIADTTWVTAGFSVPFAGRNALDGVQWALGVAWQGRSP